jgi:hypothetical protein
MLLAETEHKIRQKAAFHILFVHDFFDQSKIPEYVRGQDNTLKILNLMREHEDCEHTGREIYG